MAAGPTSKAVTNLDLPARGAAATLSAAAMGEAAAPPASRRATCICYADLKRAMSSARAGSVNVTAAPNSRLVNSSAAG